MKFLKFILGLAQLMILNLGVLLVDLYALLDCYLYVGSARTAQLNQVNGRQNTKRSDTQDLDWVSHSKQYILSP